MSIIAKMSLQSVTQFGVGRLSSLACIASNETMAMYAGAEEDRCFSKASPWGEMKISQPVGASLGNEPLMGDGPKFYVMLLTPDEAPDHDFPGAVAVANVKCDAVTRFAYDGIRVEITDDYPYDAKVRGRGVERLAWRMQVDNPPAEAQFVPGRKYFVAVYPTEQFDRDAAIAAAHRPAPSAEEAAPGVE